VGLSMAERKAVSKQVAVRYRKAARKDKAVISTGLCAVDRLAPRPCPAGVAQRVGLPGDLDVSHNEQSVGAPLPSTLDRQPTLSGRQL